MTAIYNEDFLARTEVPLFTYSSAPARRDRTGKVHIMVNPYTRFPSILNYPPYQHMTTLGKSPLFAFLPSRGKMCVSKV